MAGEVPGLAPDAACVVALCRLGFPFPSLFRTVCQCARSSGLVHRPGFCSWLSATVLPAPPPARRLLPSCLLPTSSSPPLPVVPGRPQLQVVAAAHATRITPPRPLTVRAAGLDGRPSGRRLPVACPAPRCRSPSSPRPPASPVWPARAACPPPRGRWLPRSPRLRLAAAAGRGFGGGSRRRRHPSRPRPHPAWPSWRVARLAATAAAAAAPVAAVGGRTPPPCSARRRPLQPRRRPCR